MKVFLTSFLGAVVSLPLILILLHSAINPGHITDQHIFLRLTYNLPSYYTSSLWIRDDRPDLHWEVEGVYDIIFDDAYETPIWVHPPLANIIAWPIVQLTGYKIDADDYIGFIAVGIFLISLFFIYLILKNEKLELWKIYFCFFPIILTSLPLLGVAHFYHDTFMILMLAITCYLISKNSKWSFLTACILVNTKLPAFGFLVPLAIWKKDWKMLLPALSLIPYLIATWIVTGNPFYVIDHWITMSSHVVVAYDVFIQYNIFTILLRAGYFTTIPIILISLWFWRRKPYAPIFGLACLVLGAWAFITYQLTVMLIFIPIMMSTIFTKERGKL